MHWTLRLRCPDCHATVTWEDEQPEWDEDVARQRGLERARRWARKYPFFDTLPTDKARPEYVTYPWTLGRRPAVVAKLATQFTVCPACNGFIYEDDWAPDDWVCDADEQEETA